MSWGLELKPKILTLATIVNKFGLKPVVSRGIIKPQGFLRQASSR
jgi:hypothetical protein